VKGIPTWLILNSEHLACARLLRFQKSRWTRNARCEVETGAEFDSRHPSPADENAGLRDDREEGMLIYPRDVLNFSLLICRVAMFESSVWRGMLAFGQRGIVFQHTLRINSNFQLFRYSARCLHSINHGGGSRKTSSGLNKQISWGFLGVFWYAPQKMSSGPISLMPR
jgi:hypothetical protein